MTKTIKLPPLNKLMIPKYIPYINCRDRYLNFIGSRGSGKSVAAAQIIIIRMLTNSFFKGVGIRKVDKDIKESIFKTLVDVIEEWKLNDLFTIRISPLKITCKPTGNYMIFRGLNNPTSLKSLREVSFCFFEEECCETLEDFNTIDLSFRTKRADFIQILHCLNPTLEGNPEDHWFYKFFKYGESDSMTFTKTIEGVIKDQLVKFNITSLHSSYLDNPYLPDVYKLKLEKETDEYSYAVNTLGIWARKTVEGRFYKSFSIIKNVGEFNYNRDKPIYLGIDFNSLPYSAISLFQIEGKRLYQIDEICVNDPKESSLRVALREFVKRYKGHYLNVYVIGDATGNKDDAAHEKGYNNYTIVDHELKDFKVVMDVPSKNPPVIARGEFTNEIFSRGYNGIEFIINKKCNNTINDFLYVKMDHDSTIKKEMVKNKETGQTYEKWGHLSDCCTYILTRKFSDDFESFKNPLAPTSYIGKSRSEMVKSKRW